MTHAGEKRRLMAVLRGDGPRERLRELSLSKRTFSCPLTLSAKEWVEVWGKSDDVNVRWGTSSDASYAGFYFHGVPIKFGEDVDLWDETEDVC